MRKSLLKTLVAAAVVGTTMALTSAAAFAATATLSANDLTAGDYKTYTKIDDVFALVAQETDGTEAANPAFFSVDANKKTGPETGTAYTQRLKSNGTSKGGADGYRTVEITVDGPADILVEGMSGNSSATDRGFFLTDAEGAELDSKIFLGDALYAETFSVTASGKYYLGSIKSGANIYGIVVTTDDSSSEEEKPSTPAAGTSGTLNANDLTAGDYKTYTKIDDVFALVAQETDGTEAANPAFFSVDANKKTGPETGTAYTQRLKSNGTSKGGADGYRTVEITVDGPSNILVEGMSGNSSATDRGFFLTDAEGAELDSKIFLGDALYAETFTVTKAGKYYLGSIKSGANIYGIVVTPADAEEEPVEEETFVKGTADKTAAIVKVEDKYYAVAAISEDAANNNETLTINNKSAEQVFAGITIPGSDLTKPADFADGAAYVYGVELNINNTTTGAIDLATLQGKVTITLA